MRILFIQGGSRVTKCTNGSKYVDGSFNNNIWMRYKNYGSELTVILREEARIVEEKNIDGKLNKIDLNLVNLITVPDLYKPKTNYLNFSTKKEIKDKIKQAILQCDKIIIRDVATYYTIMAAKYCIKYKKSYLIEVAGVAFDAMWYHSLLGKFVALPIELNEKKYIRKASHVVYVTENVLQKRYPSKGKILGCSDVEIQINNSNKIKYKKKKEIVTLGTAAFLDVKWKGQNDVIKAIYKLKKEGINNIRYELVGGGNAEYLRTKIRKYGLENEVKILGVLSHEKVFEWMKQIDIYIQPSYQEGLCRSIVEAMSCGCPVIASSAGGNIELVDSKFIYKKGNVNSLKKKLKEIMLEDLEEISKINYEKCKKYSKTSLDDKRDKFYRAFVEE